MRWGAKVKLLKETRTGHWNLRLKFWRFKKLNWTFCWQNLWLLSVELPSLMTEAVIVSLTMLLCFLSWLESPQSMLIETWICAEVKKTPFLSLIFYSYCTFLKWKWSASQGTPGLPLDTAKEGHPGKVVWYLTRLGPQHFLSDFFQCMSKH